MTKLGKADGATKIPSPDRKKKVAAHSAQETHAAQHYPVSKIYGVEIEQTFLKENSMGIINIDVIRIYGHRSHFVPRFTLELIFDLLLEVLQEVREAGI